MNVLDPYSLTQSRFKYLGVRFSSFKHSVQFLTFIFCTFMYSTFSPYFSSGGVDSFKTTWNLLSRKKPWKPLWCFIPSHCLIAKCFWRWIGITRTSRKRSYQMVSWFVDYREIVCSQLLWARFRANHVFCLRRLKFDTLLRHHDKFWRH